MHTTESKRTRPRWLKQVLLISSLFILLVVLIVAKLYYSVMKEKMIGYDDAKDRAFAESEIEEIDTIERFHGENAYFVLSGTDQAENPLFVFVPFNTEQAVTTIEQPEQYTKQVIADNWREQCTNCTLTAITPGIIEDTAIWEIKFKVNKDTYIYEYVHMEDGSLFEQIQYTQLFN